MKITLGINKGAKDITKLKHLTKLLSKIKGIAITGPMQKWIEKVILSKIAGKILSTNDKLQKQSTILLFFDFLNYPKKAKNCISDSDLNAKKDNISQVGKPP